MNDMKDDDEMVERDDGSSSDTTESEDMIDADAELDDLPDSDDENQSLDGTLPLNEAEEGENGHNGDKIVHMANEEHKLDRFGSLPNDGTTDETSSDDDVNGDGGLDNSENDEEDEIGEHRAVESIPDTNPVESKGEELKNEVNAAAAAAVAAEGRIAVEENNGSLKEEPVMKLETVAVERPVTIEGSNQWIPLEEVDGNDTGTEEEQVGFMKELENFHKEKCLEFKPPKFYGEGLNCLKLWRQVTRLGGYDRVTSCKLWRQVGESFKPPKTCTTVSWSFRIFYEKALLEYERHKVRGGELHIPDSSHTEHIDTQSHQPSGSGRARRDAAARAMQGWHSQRLLGNGEVGDPIIKDKNSISMSKREKQLKSVGLLKRKKPSSLERVVKAARTITKAAKPQLNDMVSDIGPAADWVKINVRRTKDCFEVYALVPGLLREEVRVQSDPAGRLVISGDPEQPDNPWGVTPFKKVISLPSRIDPHQTSAVVTLHGQLFVRVPFEQTDM